MIALKSNLNALERVYLIRINFSGGKLWPAVISRFLAQMSV